MFILLLLIIAVVALLVFLFSINAWRWAPLFFVGLALVSWQISEQLLNGRQLWAVYVVLLVVTVLWLVGPGRVRGYVYRQKVTLPPVVIVVGCVVAAGLAVLLASSLRSGTVGRVITGVIVFIVFCYLLLVLYKYMFVTVVSVGSATATHRLVSCEIYNDGHAFGAFSQHALLATFDDGTQWCVVPKLYRQLERHIGENYTVEMVTCLHGKRVIRQDPQLVG